jgi:hypothetical protein
MAGKKTLVFGIYQNAKEAERTVPELLAAGFFTDAVSVSRLNNQGAKDFAHDKSTNGSEGTAAAVTTGGVMLSVHCDTSGQITRAKDLLEQTGAQDISSSGEEVAQVFVES